MPTVETTLVIKAPVEEVYALARDIERFPEFMDDVEEVAILEQTPERQVSRWVGVVKEFNRRIRWTEEDFWDQENRVCDFELIEGDFSAYRGRWEFRPASEGTEAYLRVEYDYNIPLIGALIKKILLKKMQQNIDSMLAALKAEAEKT